MSWKSYYEKTQNSPPSPELEFALGRVNSSLPKVAVDCGCGAGRNIPFLRTRGFEVHAFDLDPDAINICSERFKGDSGSHFTCASFLSFNYPQASIIIANYSLFFCPADEFDEAWNQIKSSIISNGIFFGTFLGPNDTWAKNDGTLQQKRSILAHTIDEVRSLFSGFDIEGLDERDYDGTTAMGNEKHWHTFTVTARRRSAFSILSEE